MSIKTSITSTAPDLWRWSAADLATAIRERQVSSAEAVESCLARIDAVNASVNALIDVPVERARASAAAADAAVAAGRGFGPLHGVPIAIKDNVDEDGLINSGGLVASAQSVAVKDAPVVRNLKDAGAVSIARSNVPAFSLRWFAENEVYGRTVNPWDAAKTPGGSSGGAAAAVATGMVPLAHGNDLGGSVRYPAHVCGVMGLKPTVGRVPGWGGPSPSMPGLPPAPMLMSGQGVLARTAADIDLGLRAMARADLRDPACVPASFERDAPLRPGETIGLMRGGEGAPVDAGHEAALDDAAAWLREAGFVVEELEIPHLAEAHRLWLLLLYEDLRRLMPRIRELGDEAVIQSKEREFEVQREMWGTPDHEAYVTGHVRRTTLIAEMQELLERYPVVVMPAAGAPTPEHGADGRIETAPALLASQWPSTAIPLLGLPALTVPTGLVDGLPTGIQLLGGRFRESYLLDIAEAVESCAPVLTPIDPR